MQRQIILDTETTGLDPKNGHRIIEIGCLEMINRRLTGDYFHHYINPHYEIEQDAVEVHGITNVFLADKPDFSDVAENFLTYVENAELIIHNAPFDIGFINHEFTLLNKKKFDIKKHCHIIDSLKLARHKHPGQQNSLDALCRRYHVDNSNRDLHGALLDAELLAQVYLAMTGGQETLFHTEEEMASSNITHTIHHKIQHQAGSLPIIKPSPDEEKAHADFLERLRKEGHCIWDGSNDILRQ